MALSQLWSVSISLFLAITTRSYGQLEQQEVTVVPLRTYPCEDTDNLMDATFDLGAEEDGGRYLDMEVLLDEDVTQAWMMDLQIDMWNNGDWENNIFREKGTICDLVNKYMVNIWKKLRLQISPPILNECTIDAGSYVLKGFEVGPDDYKLPSTMLGTYRSVSTIYDQYNTPVWCQILEVEIDKN